MKVRILDKAYRHLLDGARFYERQSPGLGHYFRTSLLTDIERLKVTGGTHAVPYHGLHRSISHRFPFAIYYRIEDGQILVLAVLDSRRDPDWISGQLR